MPPDPSDRSRSSRARRWRRWAAPVGASILLTFLVTDFVDAAERIRVRSAVAESGHVDAGDVGVVSRRGGYPHAAVLVEFVHGRRACAAWYIDDAASAWVCLSGAYRDGLQTYRSELLGLAPWSVDNYGIRAGDLPVPAVAGFDEVP